MAHRTADQIATERAALKAVFRELYGQVEAILFRHDPAGISFGDNTDEYAPEVDTILPRLEGCASEADVARVVHEEFLAWFDAVDVGPRERYAAPAAEIWAAWVAFRASRWKL